MAQKSEIRNGRTEAIASTANIWWVAPAVIGGAIIGIIFAYLHIRMGGMPIGQAAGVAVVNIAIFLASYIVMRRFTPRHDDSAKAMLMSIVASIPVFVLGFIGLAYEIPVIADFAAMYILGSWLGSSEAAERAQ